MIRRLNYTGRRRINHDDARITVRLDGDGPGAFEVELNLAAYGLPAEAPVFVEAYRQTSLMRFPWGSVSDAGPLEPCQLTDFGRAEGVRFRVKIVEPATGQADGRPARLLALADRLCPRRIVESVEQSESLLAVESADIDEVWELRFDGDGADEPILRINERLVTDRQALVRSDQFVSLVLPEVFRAVLSRVLLAEADGEPEDASDWRTLWLRMAKTLPGVGALPTVDGDHHDELEVWIEACVGAFSRKFTINRRFSEWWTGEVHP